MVLNQVGFHSRVFDETIDDPALGSSLESIKASSGMYVQIYPEASKIIKILDEEGPP
jgi:hypothetical protein